MSSAAQSYRTQHAARVALVGAGLVAATAVAPVISLPESPLVRAEVRLTDAVGDLLGGLDGIQNVPANFLIDLANIPYNLFSAPYDVTGRIPSDAADAAASGLTWNNLLPITDPTPSEANPAFIWDNIPAHYGALNGDEPAGVYGAINNLADALRFTDSWWASSPTNVWGWDTANPWNFTALINTLIPIKPLSEPLADNLNTIMAAEFPIATEANKFFMSDLLGELKTLFQVPLSDLVNGTFTFDPTQSNPIGLGADALGNGGHDFYTEFWNNDLPTLNPTLGLDSYWGHLTGSPAANPLNFPSLNDIVPTFVNAYQAMNIDFGLFPGPGSEFSGTESFLFQGAEQLYGLPTALNGIINGTNGLLPGSGIQIIPDAVTNILGGGLNDLIGPDTLVAQTLSSLNEQLMTAIYSAMDVIAPGAITGIGGDAVSGISADALASLVPDLSAMLAPMLAGNLGDLANPLNFIDPMMFLSMF